MTDSERGYGLHASLNRCVLWSFLKEVFLYHEAATRHFLSLSWFTTPCGVLMALTLCYKEVMVRSYYVFACCIVLSIPHLKGEIYYAKRMLVELNV